MASCWDQWSSQDDRCHTAWDGEVAEAREDLTALDETGVHGRVVELRRTTIRGGLAAREGHATKALLLYKEALPGWRIVGLAWDEALTGIDMATMLQPSDPEVRAAVSAARDILVHVGAKPFVARLDAAMGAQAPRGDPVQMPIADRDRSGAV